MPSHTATCRDACHVPYKHKLTHWGRVTHICISNLTIIGSDKGLSPCRRQAIIWTNAEIMLTGPSGTNTQWNLSRNSCIFIQENAFENAIWKIAAILSRPQCDISAIAEHCVHTWCTDWSELIDLNWLIWWIDWSELIHALIYLFYKYMIDQLIK